MQTNHTETTTDCRYEFTTIGREAYLRFYGSYVDEEACGPPEDQR